MSNTSKKGGESMVRLALSLFAITLVAALVLSGLNSVTAPKIAENNMKVLQETMQEIIPGADFEEVSIDGADPIITAAYKATINGEDAGYCVQVTPSSYGGAITEIVGVAADGTIAGAKVTSTSDTPGLGTHAQDADWIAQYVGMPADGSLAVEKDGGNVVAITGSTITSRAVTLGVNTAATFVAGLA